MLGAAKPPTAKVPIILDQFAAMSFLGVLAGALYAESVLKDVRCSPTMVGQQVGSELFTLVDDGTLIDRPGAPRRSTTKACRPGAPSCSRAAR